MVAASTGWSLSSVTLPLIWPLCANAGAVTNARPRARIDVATARRMMAPVMESSSVQVGFSTHPHFITLYRPSGDVRDQVFADGPPARGARVDRPPRLHGRRLQAGLERPPVAGVQRPD